jgi:hypothetical protein
MAIWLHGQTAGGDQAIPIAPTPPGIDPDRVYPLNDLLGILRDQAARIAAIPESEAKGG